MDTLSDDDELPAIAVGHAEFAQATMSPAECVACRGGRVPFETRHHARRQTGRGSPFGLFPPGAFTGFADFAFLGGPFCGFLRGAFFFFTMLRFSFGFQPRGFLGLSFGAFEIPQRLSGRIGLHTTGTRGRTGPNPAPTMPDLPIELVATTLYL